MGIHVLENDRLTVRVSDDGAELFGVFDKESGAERIWNTDPAVWNRHAPILFPFVGRIAGNEYRVGGKSYAMKTQHGFARDMEFACVDKTDDSVTHRLTATEATKAVYPYDFVLTVRHSLDRADPRLLKVEWRIENRGGERMYFSIGGHPGFMLPEGVKKEDACISFPGKTSLTYFSVGSDGLALPRRKYTLRTEDGRAAFDTSVYDTWIFAHEDIGTVCITDSSGKPYITMNCEGFPLLAVWAKDTGPFICLEPWYGRTDDSGFDGDLSDKPEIEHLEPGEEKSISYSMKFNR